MPNETTVTAQEMQETPQTGDATGEQAGGGQNGTPRTFTQADVDKMITDRLEQERRKATKAADAARAEAERKAAEEQGEFKRLYDQEKAQREQAENKARELELSAPPAAAAAKVGLPPALADRLRGETPDEMEADAKSVLAALPKPAAPNINNGAGGAGAQDGMDDATRREYAARLGVNEKYFKVRG